MVGPDMLNMARELEVHMSHPGTENWKTFGCFFGCLEVKKTKGIITRKPEVLKVVMFF